MEETSNSVQAPASVIGPYLPDSLQAIGPLLENVVLALLTLIIGMWVAGFACQLVRTHALRAPRVDQTLAQFLASLVRYAILAVVIIAVLQRFGVEATSLVAILGAATLAIGLALQGTLGNLAAGVMLILFRPYKVGDYVEVAGQSGTVKDIDLFTTELATPDNVQIVIPNGACWGDSIVNYSAHPVRRADLTFGISYNDDIDQAISVILQTIRADGRALSQPAEPWVRVINLGDSSVDLQARVWVNAPDYWEFRFAMLKNVKVAFDSNGIEIPYPHQVEIQKQAAE